MGERKEKQRYERTVIELSQSKRKHSSDSMAPLISSAKSFNYILFLYREELQRRKRNPYNGTIIKLSLTEALVKQTINNIHNCSTNDLQFLYRETVYKNRLKHVLDCYYSKRRKQQRSVVSINKNYKSELISKKGINVAAMAKDIKKIDEVSGVQPTLKRKVRRQLWSELKEKEEGQHDKKFKTDFEESQETR
uniref:Uncharacterized protein n=1 Tax=Glossina brevipalpis TaxID=37001 RepID=A0A1A9WNB3_9MUSC